MDKTKSQQLKAVREELAQLGLTKIQINRMIQARIDRTDTEIPFRQTDIKKRYADFQALFEQYHLKKETLNNVLSRGLMFSSCPQQYNQLFYFLEQSGVSIEKFLKIAETDMGCETLARSPKALIHNIKEMSENLAPYGITPQKWVEMGLKRPFLLKKTPPFLLMNIEKMTSFISEQGYTKKDWIEAAIRNPAILDHKPSAMIEKQKEIAGFLNQYNIKPNEWIASCLKTPQLFYTGSDYIQQRFQFYIDAYQKGEFVFANLKQQSTKHLIQTLLTSPQYLCYSDENLNYRKEYMDYLNQTGQATSSVLYRPLSYIKNALNQSRMP